MIGGGTACCCSGASKPLAQAVCPYQPLNGVVLDLVGEIAAYIIGLFFKLKAVMTVLCGFLNSPIAKARIEVFFFDFLISLLWWSKQMVWASSLLLPKLCSTEV
jgi:hypothetical protein